MRFATRCNDDATPASGALVRRTGVEAAWGDPCGPDTVAPSFTQAVRPVCGYAGNVNQDKKWWTLLPYPAQLGFNQTTTGGWPAFPSCRE